MIPTVVIVNDDNPELLILGHLLKKIVRVYFRDSVQGEQLYGIFEGVLLFDRDGKRAMNIRDNYDCCDIVTRVVNHLDGLDQLNTKSLVDLLKRRQVGTKLNSSEKELIDNNTARQITAYLEKIGLVEAENE